MSAAKNHRQNPQNPSQAKDSHAIQRCETSSHSPNALAAHSKNPIAQNFAKNLAQQKRPRSEAKSSPKIATNPRSRAVFTLLNPALAECFAQDLAKTPSRRAIAARFAAYAEGESHRRSRQSRPSSSPAQAPSNRVPTPSIFTQAPFRQTSAQDFRSPAKIRQSPAAPTQNNFVSPSPAAAANLSHDFAAPAPGGGYAAQNHAPTAPRAFPPHSAPVRSITPRSAIFRAAALSAPIPPPSLAASAKAAAQKLAQKIIAFARIHPIFLAFLGLYCGVLVAFSRYTFNLDDIWMWLDIAEKKPIWNGYNPASGRFFPLASLDLNLLMQISPSPYLFFAFNALLALAFALVALKSLRFVSQDCRRNALLVGFFMLSVGFVVVFFGICYPDRLLMLFLSGFVLASLKITRQASLKAAAAGILSLNLALYLKEPIFIAGAIFAGGLFFAALKMKDKFLRNYSLAAIASCGLYALFYVALIVGKTQKSYSRYTPNSDLWTLKAQGLLNFALNDALIIFTLSALLVFRIWRIARHKEPLEPIFDAALLAGFAYFCVFLVLGIFEFYYLLPCYVFAGFAMIYFLATRGYARVLFVKIALICGLLGYFSSSFLSGIYTMANLKAQGVQFNEVLDFCAEYFKKHPGSAVYFAGTGRGREIYAEWYVGYFIEYLNRLYGVRDFDVRTDMPNGKDIAPREATSPYTYSNSLDLSTPKRGDLVVLNNATTLSGALDSLLKAHTLLYRTDSPTLPYVNLKVALKLLNARLVGSRAAIFGHSNVLKLPLDSYIFRVEG